MKLRTMTYLLLLLMTFQSSVSLADIHMTHQSGLEHLTFDGHQHAEDEHHTSSIEQSENGERDCHHCCHCHGHCTPAITIAFNRFCTTKSSSPVPEYSDKALPDTFESFLRPPIA